MGLIPLGILSSAGAGGAVGDYELIESYILGSAQSSVTFSNLGDFSTRYRHLQVRILGRTDRAVEGTDTLRMILNSNTTNTSYAQHTLVGTGSAVASGADTGNTIYTSAIGQLAGGGADTSIWYPTIIDILDSYSTTKNKTIRSMTGTEAPNVNGSRARSIELKSMLFMSTASITSIQFDQAIGSNFSANSRFSLYGIKG